jgi:Tol biopolymer transport system component
VTVEVVSAERSSIAMNVFRPVTWIVLVGLVPPLLADRSATAAPSGTEPALLAPGVISTGDYESHPAFTPDGSELYFLKSTPSFDFWTIVVSRLGPLGWGPPHVAPFSGLYSDADPFVTADGRRLYFISNRPLVDTLGAPPRSDLDIWVVERAGPRDAWGRAHHLPAPVNGPGNEWFPTVASDGTLYFGSDREGGRGRTDLWRCQHATDGTYAPAENLGDSLNTAFNEFEPWIAPDQSYLVFMGGGRSDGRGGFDLYVSYNRGGTWSRPVNLGDKINSSGNELSPHLSFDGRTFYWTSTRGGPPPAAPMDYDALLDRLHRPGNGLGDVYQIDARELGIGR